MGLAGEKSDIYESSLSLVEEYCVHMQSPVDSVKLGDEDRPLPLKRKRAEEKDQENFRSLFSLAAILLCVCMCVFLLIRHVQGSSIFKWDWTFLQKNHFTVRARVVKNELHVMIMLLSAKSW